MDDTNSPSTTSRQAAANAATARTDRGAPPRRSSFDIAGMRCASCVETVQRALRAVDGVLEAEVNFATGRARAIHDPARAPIAAIHAAVRAAGYEVEGGTDSSRARDADDPLTRAKVLDARQRREERAWRRRAIAGIALSTPQMALMFADSLPARGWWMGALTLPVVAWVALPFHRGLIAAIRRRRADMDTLISGGAGVAFGYSVVELLRSTLAGDSSEAPHLWFETAAFVVAFVALGKWLETLARGRAARAIRRLLELAPATARVERASDGSDDAHASTEPLEVEVATAAIEPGDVVRVRPGERIAVDGEVIEGESRVDESMLSGEPTPVARGPGDEVAAGSINGAGFLRVVARRTGADTTLAAIVRLVEAAQTTKTRIERLADRVSAVFVPIVLAIAFVASAAWCVADLARGEPVDVARAMSVLVSVLVVACPCALGLATPTAILVGTGVGARRGILIARASALEAAERIDTIALDKTGTLTAGKPAVVEVLPARSIDADDLLRLAAAAEIRSEHPLAAAIVAAARERALVVPPATDFEVRAGAGVAATVEGRRVAVGRPDAIEAAAVRDEARPETLVEVRVDDRAIGRIAIADPLRSTSRAAIAELHARGLRTLLLTGDAPGPAASVAAQVGIAPGDVRARLSPTDKAAAVRALRESGRRVAMVGDGINDAPALASADVAVAVASGSDIAAASADVVLGGDGIAALPVLLELARATMRKVRQNLFWALLYNSLLLPLAACGLVHPMLAAAAMSLSSVSVVANSLHLARSLPARQPSTIESPRPQIASTSR